MNENYKGEKDKLWIPGQSEACFQHRVKRAMSPRTACPVYLRVDHNGCLNANLNAKGDKSSPLLVASAHLSTEGGSKGAIMERSILSAAIGDKLVQQALCRCGMY
jgi:hypothetical protein